MQIPGLAAVLDRHLSAALDMLDNAIVACPEQMWAENTPEPPYYWHLVYHTLFFLDLYFSESLTGFAPPKPFTLSEIDPAGVLPERVYSKSELRDYLEHGRQKARVALENLSDEGAVEPRSFPWIRGTTLDFVLTTIRHVQHHTAQLNLLLRQRTGDAPPWVSGHARP